MANHDAWHCVFSPWIAEPEQVLQSGKNKVYLMTWAQRLKWVFAIEIEKCEKCGGKVKIIASIEDPDYRKDIEASWSG